MCSARPLARVSCWCAPRAGGAPDVFEQAELEPVAALDADGEVGEDEEARLAVRVVRVVRAVEGRDDGAERRARLAVLARSLEPAPRARAAGRP
jgi:hypothetical protein